MILSLDTSINNTGYAFGKDGKILRSGVIKTRVEDGWLRLYELARGVKALLGAKTRDVPRVAIVEIPGTFAYARSAGRGGKGLNQAAMQKINMAAGALILTLQEWGIEVETIEAHRWKGRRPKEMDMLLAKQHIGRACTHDEADAVMLCVWRMMGK